MAQSPQIAYSKSRVAFKEMRPASRLATIPKSSGVESLHVDFEGRFHDSIMSEAERNSQEIGRGICEGHRSTDLSYFNIPLSRAVTNSFKEQLWGGEGDMPPGLSVDLVEDFGQPNEIGRIIRSFDPRSVCFVHGPYCAFPL
jgi:Ni,Fe-hydrogenase I large subunit